MQAQEALTTPEVARRLGIDPAQVYELIFTRSLVGRPGEDGRVYVAATEVERYLHSHADGVG
jgi:hypothetical protein